MEDNNILIKNIIEVVNTLYNKNIFQVQRYVHVEEIIIVFKLIIVTKLLYDALDVGIINIQRNILLGLIAFMLIFPIYQ